MVRTRSNLPPEAVHYVNDCNEIMFFSIPCRQPQKINKNTHQRKTNTLFTSIENTVYQGDISLPLAMPNVMILFYEPILHSVAYLGVYYVGTTPLAVYLF